MSSLAESWEQTKAHLARAAELVGDSDLETFYEYVEHNELQLAADVLVEIGDEREDLPRPFWESLKWAYENMRLQSDAQACGLRMYEAEHGYVEARLTLLSTDDGGRHGPIFNNYRPSWNIGNRTPDGAVEFNDAPVTLEDCRSLLPGQVGVVRLHPMSPQGWRHVREGDQIDMQEGSRVTGKAVVLRVCLREITQ